MKKSILLSLLFLFFAQAYGQLPDNIIDQFRNYQIAAETKDNIENKYEFVDVFFSLYCCSPDEQKQELNQALNLNEEKTLALIKQWAIETQDSYLYFNIGMYYDFGIGVGGMDEITAKHTSFQWWEKAAKLGNSEAQNNLGIIYKDQYSSNRYGVTVNIPNSIYWLERAAQAGNIQGIRNLAAIYLDGEVMPQDTKKAISIYENALSLNLNLDHLTNIYEQLINIYSEDSHDFRKNCQKAKYYLNKLKDTKYYTVEYSEKLSDKVVGCLK